MYIYIYMLIGAVSLFLFAHILSIFQRNDYEKTI